MTGKDPQERFDRLTERYASGDVPWDDALPPPELRDLIATLPPGRALDLGCGYGRASIYMAQRGWQVDGVDFVPQAIEEARRRVATAGVNVTLYVGDVTQLDFLSGQYDLALDVGCGHALDDAGWRAYAAHLGRLLHPGAVFLLFGRVNGPNSAEPQSWIDESVLLASLSNSFRLINTEHGETIMPDDSWTSAWYRFERV